MEFEWDEAKSDATLRSRGIDFDFAVGIFDGPILASIDVGKDNGEARARAIGQTDGATLAVIYADRDGVRRIISARRANTKERQLWLLSAAP
jgi:uncharacterized DUF497 family protein